MGVSEWTPCCGCVFLIAVFIGAVYSWYALVADMKFYQKQVASKCVDARFLGDPYVYNTTNVFVRDGGMKNTGAIDVICYYHTAVYYCYDEDIDIGDWNGQCVDLAHFPSTNPMHNWPMVHHAAVKDCFKKKTMNADHCTEHKWDCPSLVSGGGSKKCTAHQKALHVCWQKHRPDPYTCFAIRGDTNAGIREHATPFPTLWFVLFLLLISILLVSCLGLARNGTTGDSEKFRCAISCGALFCYLLLLVMACFVYQPSSEEEAESFSTTTNGTAWAPPRDVPARNGLSTGELFLVVFGSSIVLAVLYIFLRHPGATCEILWYGASKSKALWSCALSSVVEGTDAGSAPLGWRIYDLTRDEVAIRTSGTRVRVTADMRAAQKLCYNNAVGWWAGKGWACDKVGTVFGSDKIGPGVRVRFQVDESNEERWFSLAPSALYLESADVPTCSLVRTSSEAGTGAPSDFQEGVACNACMRNETVTGQPTPCQGDEQVRVQSLTHFLRDIEKER